MEILRKAAKAAHDVKKKSASLHKQIEDEEISKDGAALSVCLSEEEKSEDSENTDKEDAGERLDAEG